MATLVHVNDESTREDLALALRYMNDRAMTLSRGGRKGTDSTAYADLHETLDELLTAWEKAPA